MAGPKTGDTAAKDQRRRDKKEASRKANVELEKVQAKNEQLKGEIAKKSEDSEEYKKLKEELKELGISLEDVEAKAKQAREEEDALSQMVVEDGDNPLFVSAGAGGSTPGTVPPVAIDLTAPNGESKRLPQDDDEEPMFTSAQYREATGQNTDGGKIVAWRRQDRSTPVIVMYGPKNAAKYERSTAAREDNDFDEDDTDRFGPEHRLGDVKNDNKKYVRRRRELIAIIGLAYNCHVEDLKPREKGEARRVAPLEIWIKWEIDGVIFKQWEIRSSIRHLFSSPKKCDDYIYTAAQWHAKRHQEWLDGERAGKDLSATPPPRVGLSVTPPPRVGVRATPPPAAPVVKPDPDGNDQPEVAPPADRGMDQFKELWCGLNGIDPQKMSEKQQGKFITAWMARNEA